MEGFMTAKSLAETVERFKELRRKGDSRSVEAFISDESLLDQTETIRTQEQDLAVRSIPVGPERADAIFRSVATLALAERVFGNRDKAQAWLTRPNRALNGQRPADLLQDELGAAVVQELLEQIDHGIFA
jgi:putative toxin-antitoxin system antitoxin component (TIGR02293 family)